MGTGLVILDCDGVLIDSEVLAVDTLVGLLRTLGAPVDAAFVERHFLGRSFPVVREVMAATFGLALPEAFEATCQARLAEIFAERLRPMPGAAEAVARLGVPYCVATSSSPERLARSLEITGLAPLFAGRTFTASRVAQGKPAPDLFLLAAREMGVPPAACLVIEDSDPGIRAGLAAGMRVWRFTGGSHLRRAGARAADAPQAHRELSDLADLFRLDPSLERAACGAVR